MFNKKIILPILMCGLMLFLLPKKANTQASISAQEMLQQHLQEKTETLKNAQQLQNSSVLTETLINEVDALAEQPEYLDFLSAVTDLELPKFPVFDTQIKSIMSTLLFKDESDTDLSPEKNQYHASLEPQPSMISTFDDTQTSEIVKIKGKITSELQPVARFKNYCRWVLATDDNLRIPLKSNYKLLDEIRKQDIFDSSVELTGEYRVSPFNPNLKYFVVDSARILPDPDGSLTPYKAQTTKKTFSFRDKIKD